MEFINPGTVYWDEWVIFFVQVATLIFLMVYVWKTWEMATATRSAAEASSAAAIEAKEARMEALAPRLMVYFSPDQIQLAEVVVENIGAGTAANVKITFEPPLQASSKQLDVNRFFETIKPIFPPRYRLLHGIDTWASYLGAKLPMRYDVRVTYTGKENGRGYDEVHVLDIESLAHRVEFGKKDIEDLVKEVEKIATVLDDKLKKIDSHLEFANALDFHQVDERPLRHLLTEIHACWEAAKSVAADQKARLCWEPTIRSMRKMTLNAVLSAARESAPESERETITNVLTLLYVPAYLRRDNYDKELEQAMQNLISICQPEYPRESGMRGRGTPITV